MGKMRRQHNIDGLLVLLLFGVFAASILMVLLTGADAYKRLTDRDDSSYDMRTGAQYISGKLRQAVSGDNVSIEDFGGTPAICMTETIKGKEYITRIFYHDGYIREIFSAEDVDLTPDDGWKVLRSGGLDIFRDGNVMKVVITEESGKETTVISALRQREAVAE